MIPKPENAQIKKAGESEHKEKNAVSPVKKVFQLILAVYVIVMAVFFSTAYPGNPVGAGIIPEEVPAEVPEEVPEESHESSPLPTPETPAEGEGVDIAELPEGASEADVNISQGDGTEAPDEIAELPGEDRKNLLEAEVQNITPLENCVDETGYAFYNEAAFNRQTGDKMLDEAAQEVLNSITNDTMTKKEKARAIFDFVQGKIRYMGTSDKSNYRIAAIDAISTRMGDCYSYYAAARALLTVAGIDNLEVRRVCDTSDHWWNLVNCGDGWYHFDATPRGGKMPQFVSFMFTDQQAENYTRDTVNMVGYPNYYTFDGSILPERAS